MFLCKSVCRPWIRNPWIRTYSISSNNNEIKKKDDDKKNYQKLSFMPVINIPENELAHNAFFSLHRPLLGLSEFDIEERPFFADPVQIEEQREKSLNMYMSTLEPFNTPLPPDQIPAVDLNEYREEVSLEEDYGEMIELGTDQPSLPVFHMPESEDVVDYLSLIESSMKLKHTRIEEAERKESRLRKMDILNQAQYLYTLRFYVSHNRHPRLRRYHQKWMMYH